MLQCVNFMISRPKICNFVSSFCNASRCLDPQSLTLCLSRARWGKEQLSVAQCAVSPPGQRAVVSAEDPHESEPHRRLRSLHRCWRRPENPARLTAGTLPGAPLSWPGALLLLPHKPRAATAALRLTSPPSQVEPEQQQVYPRYESDQIRNVSEELKCEKNKVTFTVSLVTSSELCHFLSIMSSRKQQKHVCWDFLLFVLKKIKRSGRWNT